MVYNITPPRVQTPESSAPIAATQRLTSPISAKHRSRKWQCKPVLIRTISNARLQLRTWHTNQPAQLRTQQQVKPQSQQQQTGINENTPSAKLSSQPIQTGGGQQPGRAVPPGIPVKSEDGRSERLMCPFDGCKQTFAERATMRKHYKRKHMSVVSSGGDID
jgi:hypothetical protein